MGKVGEIGGRSLPAGGGSEESDGKLDRVGEGGGDDLLRGDERAEEFSALGNEFSQRVVAQRVLLRDEGHPLALGEHSAQRVQTRHFRRNAQSSK